MVGIDDEPLARVAAGVDFLGEPLAELDVFGVTAPGDDLIPDCRAPAIVKISCRRGRDRLHDPPQPAGAVREARPFWEPVESVAEAEEGARPPVELGVSVVEPAADGTADQPVPGRDVAAVTALAGARATIEPRHVGFLGRKARGGGDRIAGPIIPE